MRMFVRVYVRMTVSKKNGNSKKLDMLFFVLFLVVVAVHFLRILFGTTLNEHKRHIKCHDKRRIYDDDDGCGWLWEQHFFFFHSKKEIVTREANKIHTRRKQKKKRTQHTETNVEKPNGKKNCVVEFILYTYEKRSGRKIKRMRSR